MATHTVTWTIDLDADSHADAVQQAHDMCRDPESIATYYRSTLIARPSDSEMIDVLHLEEEENAWKVTKWDDSDDVLYISSSRNEAENKLARLTACGIGARLYSCHDDGNTSMSEWEIETWNCDLDTGMITPPEAPDMEDNADDSNIPCEQCGSKENWLFENFLCTDCDPRTNPDQRKPFPKA